MEFFDFESRIQLILYDSDDSIDTSLQLLEKGEMSGFDYHSIQTRDPSVDYYQLESADAPYPYDGITETVFIATKGLYSRWTNIDSPEGWSRWSFYQPPADSQDHYRGLHFGRASGSDELFCGGYKPKGITYMGEEIVGDVPTSRYEAVGHWDEYEEGLRANGYRRVEYWVDDEGQLRQVSSETRSKAGNDDSHQVTIITLSGFGEPNRIVVPDLSEDE